MISKLAALKEDVAIDVKSVEMNEMGSRKEYVGVSQQILSRCIARARCTPSHGWVVECSKSQPRRRNRAWGHRTWAHFPRRGMA